LGVPSEFDLIKWMDKLDKENIKFKDFKEPDIGNQITAISSVTDNYKIFKKLKLLSL